MRFWHIVSVTVCVSLMAACTPLRWEHPVLGVAQSGNDLDECQHTAWAEANRYAFFYEPWPRYYRDRDGRLRLDPRPFPAGRRDTFLLEQQFQDVCMRAKGYSLVPAT